MSALIEESTMGRRVLPGIILIACGSFSPPTLMHFRMFEIARDHFELHGSHEVIGGIVSPTHDAYGKKGLLPANHRCAMVKLALQTSKWIRMSDWETQQNEWSRTLKVLQYHQNCVNNYIKSGELGNDKLPSWLPPGVRDKKDPVQLRLLCGADLLESFAVPGLWAEEDIEEIIGNHGLVVISRSGANPERFIFESDILTKYQRNITLVTNWVSNDVSSTMIRRLLGRGMSVKYLIDDSVLEYITKYQLFNYRPDSIKKVQMPTPPARLTYNVEYINQVHLEIFADRNNDLNMNESYNTQNDKIAALGNQSPDNGDDHDDDDDNDNTDNDGDDERMDETDFAVKNILHSFKLNNRGKVFCCGEADSVGTKLMPHRHSPGQAIRTVITAECGNGGGSSKSNVHRERLREGEELKPKKMKITAPQNV